MKSLNQILIAGLIGIGLLVPPMTKAGTELANVTGCLVRGDRGHQYSLTDANGTKYELRPSVNVFMKKHVGQKVAVTGELIKGKSDEQDNAAYLRVTDVKMISGSCQ